MVILLISTVLIVLGCFAIHQIYCKFNEQPSGIEFKKGLIYIFISGLCIILIFVGAITLFGELFIAINQQDTQKDITTSEITIFDVYSVTTYYQPSTIETMSDTGYIIQYIDQNEICTLKISSDDLTVKTTDNESYLIYTNMYPNQLGGWNEYELYLNIDEINGDLK